MISDETRRIRTAVTRRIDRYYFQVIILTLGWRVLGFSAKPAKPQLFVTKFRRGRLGAISREVAAPQTLRPTQRAGTEQEEEEGGAAGGSAADASSTTRSGRAVRLRLMLDL